MQDTRLPEESNRAPAACLWQGKLVVAWLDGKRGGALSVAVGNAATAGNYQPTITRLPDVASGFGSVAVTEYGGNLYLGWVDAATRALLLAVSYDGITFGPPVTVAAAISDGPALHGNGRLYVSWIEDGSRRIVIAAGNGATFDAPVTLGHDTETIPALTSFEHPYHGHRLALTWGVDSELFFVTGSPAHLQSLDVPPVKIWNFATPTICMSGPPASAYVGPTIAVRTLDEEVALLSVDMDGTHYTSPRTGPLADSGGPAVAAFGTDLLLAFCEPQPHPNLRVGSWASVFEIPDDIKHLVGKPCDPRQCTVDPRLVCTLTGETGLEYRPAEVRNARRGDIILSPADGDGVIGTILKSLIPHEFYDHMGIMLADGNLIRHCTEAKDRIMRDKDYFTGSLLGDPAPTEGLRPDLVKYGWPGPITQTIQDGFFDGWNSGLNPEWNYHELAGAIFDGNEDSLTREQRDAFFDRERPEKAVQISNLTYAPTYRADHPTGPLWPLVVRPPRNLEAQMPWVRWGLNRVADRAEIIRGHYRFYAYTDAHIAFGTAKLAPNVGDAAWAGLPSGADWAAGTPGLVCSTFVWFAARHALDGLVPRILLDQDTTNPHSEGTRASPGGVNDGLFAYQAGERLDSASGLHAWITKNVRDTVKRNADAQITGLARFGVGAVAGLLAGPAGVTLGFTLSPADARDIIEGLTNMPEHVANGICNAFASDEPEKINDQLWKSPGEGLSVSPDGILNFWDAPGEASDERWGLWGDSERMMLANPRPELVDIGRIELSPGVAHVTGVVMYGGRILVGAEVAIGCRKAYVNAHGGFALDVPASPTGSTRRDQLVRFQAYWDAPPGTLSTKVYTRLEVGLNNLGIIRLDPPPEWRRRVELHGELVMKHQVMFGHDTIAHHAVSKSLFLQCDPDMAQFHRQEYDAAIRQTFSDTTDRCSGERAEFSGVAYMLDPTPAPLPGAPPAPAPTPPAEGPLAVIVDWKFIMWDGEDGDEENIDEQSGQVIIAPGKTVQIIPSLRDGDIPPDRAHAGIWVDNFVNPA